MPIVPVETVRRRRLVSTVAPAVVAATAAWLAVALVVMPIRLDPPVITQPPTTVEDASTNTTADDQVDAAVVVPSGATEVGVAAEFLEDAAAFGPGDLIALDDVGADAWCLVAGTDGDLFIVDGSGIHRWSGSESRHLSSLVAWDDFEPVAATGSNGMVAVAGTGPGGLEVRTFDENGATISTVVSDFEPRDVLGITTDAAGDPWLQVDNVLPVDAGFAATQWFNAAGGSRLESKPYPDGSAVAFGTDWVALTQADGDSIRWNFHGVDIGFVDRFEDGVIASLTPTGDSSAVFVVLRPSSDIVAARWDTSMPISGRTTAHVGWRIYAIGAGNDSALMESIALDGAIAPASIDVSEARWISGDAASVFDDAGNEIARYEIADLGRRATAWDGDAGIVMLTPDGIEWRAPGEARTIAASGREIVGTSYDGRSHVVGVRTLVEPSTVTWYELETGDIVAQPDAGRTVDGTTFTAQGRIATVVEPDWTGVQLGEGGEPIAPFDLPQLVVYESDDAELLRINVGSEDRPYVRLHDFDGRRLILTAEPHEPAMPPMTVWIIDLQCPECTERIELGDPQWFDLVGSADATGEVRTPTLG
jgi:hypothetical protein